MYDRSHEIVSDFLLFILKGGEWGVIVIQSCNMINSLESYTYASCETPNFTFENNRCRKERMYEHMMSYIRYDLLRHFRLRLVAKNECTNT